MTTVLFADTPEAANPDHDIEASILGPNVDIVRYVYEGDADKLIAACRDVDVILTAYVPLTRTVIEALPSCRLISVSATGYSAVNIEAAADRGISVCAIDDYCAGEVADHTLLLMLALARRLPDYHSQVQLEHRWEWDSMSGLRRMSDLTLGLIGFGAIGQAVARRAQGFDMSVIANDPWAVTASASELGVQLCELEEIFTRSDIISLHCPLTSENENFVNRDAFRRMRNTPILINTARGGLVDEAALIEALDTGQVAAAGLDVLSEESPNIEVSPFIDRPNVILTPHVAFYSDWSILENRRLSASNIRHFLDGEHDRVRKYIHQAGSE
jgi:phosphoglycerate dehydrogenase-like enzyme